MCIEGFTFFADVVDQLSQVLNIPSIAIKIFYGGKEIKVNEPVEGKAKAFSLDTPLTVKIDTGIFYYYVFLGSALKELEKECSQLEEILARQKELCEAAALKQKKAEFAQKSAEKARHLEESKKKAIQAEKRWRAIPAFTKEQKEWPFFGPIDELKKVSGFDIPLQNEVKEISWKEIRAEMVTVAKRLIETTDPNGLTVPMTSEANRRLWINGFLLGVFNIDAGSFKCTEHRIESEFSIYAYDLDHMEKERCVDVCLSNVNKGVAVLLIERKGENIDDIISQNADQLRAYASSALLMEAFGIATNGIEWFFTHYTYRPSSEKGEPSVLSSEDFSISGCYKLSFPIASEEQVLKIIEAMLATASIANKVLKKKS